MGCLVSVDFVLWFLSICMEFQILTRLCTLASRSQSPDWERNCSGQLRCQDRKGPKKSFSNKRVPNQEIGNDGDRQWDILFPRNLFYGFY